VIDDKIIQDWLQNGTIMSKEDGSFLIGWGNREWLSEPKDHTYLPCFYFPDFFLKEATPWFVHEHSVEVGLSELLGLLTPAAKPRLSDYSWKNPYQQLFRLTFDELLCKFKQKEMEKAVPFVMESTFETMTQEQLVSSLVNILNYSKENPVYLYGYWDEHDGILGATPELLFRYADGMNLETMACAGTMGLQKNSAAFLSDPKELHEHRLVVQSITESLSSFGNVSVGPLQLLKLPQLIHLVTPIKLQMQQSQSFETLTYALHPTSAVGAFPRTEGMCWLNEYHKLIDRRRFGAPVGYLWKNNANCYVGIRNVQWSESEMMIGAGCGLVSESHYEMEWSEILLKLQAIKEMLAL